MAGNIAIQPVQFRPRTPARQRMDNQRQGDLNLKDHQPGDEAEQRVANMLRLVASSREFQLA